MKVVSRLHQSGKPNWVTAMIRRTDLLLLLRQAGSKMNTTAHLLSFLFYQSKPKQELSHLLRIYRRRNSSHLLRSYTSGTTDPQYRSRNSVSHFSICKGSRHRNPLFKFFVIEHQPRPRGTSPPGRNCLVTPATPEGLPYSLFYSVPVDGVSAG